MYIEPSGCVTRVYMLLLLTAALFYIVFVDRICGLSCVDILNIKNNNKNLIKQNNSSAYVYVGTVVVVQHDQKSELTTSLHRP